ncbi:MAG: tryptophan-rich sensory protein [Alphaproteobacteria bacterium]|nr:tryptophan-rich sensory protein [Alphaproteobacteria bacterium]
MFQKSYLNFLFSLAVVVITALLCSWFNRIGMQSFYGQIQKSSLTPPNIVFPIVWTALYVLLVLSFDLILNEREKHIMPAVWLFLGNLVLQVIWCWAFFARGYFLVGLIVLAVLVLATAALLYRFHLLNRIAGWLLLPYMIWLLFATYLNWSVVALNGNNFVF